jgi:hypothetical protein
MKSDPHTAEKQSPQSVKQDDKRPPDKIRDAAWTFIEKIRQDDPTTLVPAVESSDDRTQDGRSKVMSGEQGGNHPPRNIPEATRTFIKELSESGYERPVVEELGSGSSKVQTHNPAPQSSSAAAKKIHDATKIYIEKLRESGYERPVVTLVEKDSNSLGRQNGRSVERAGGPTLDDIHAAARTFITGVKQSDPKEHDTAEVTLAEKGSKASEHMGVSERSMEQHKTITPSSSLPPRDSPLTTMFLGQYVSALMLETIKYLKLSYAGLAHQMSIPEMVLRDAVEGKMGLTRGQWVRLGKALGLPTTYELRPCEQDGVPCWEVCFPPVHVPMDKA